MNNGLTKVLKTSFIIFVSIILSFYGCKNKKARRVEKKEKVSGESISGVSKEFKYVNGKGVRFRTAPSLDGHVKAILKDGERVRIIKRSSAKEKIGSYEDYWYKVQRDNMDIGWVYGAFLIDKIKKSSEGKSPYVGEYIFKANLRYATGWNGGFLILSEDGRYVFAPPDSSYRIHKYKGKYYIKGNKLILDVPEEYTISNPIVDGGKEHKADISRANVVFPMYLYIKFDPKTGKPFLLINEDDYEVIDSPSELPVDTSCYEKVK